MTKADLKIGEIYKWIYSNTNTIFFNKIESLNEGKIKLTCFITTTGTYFKGGTATFEGMTVEETTPEEKHWLNECIRLNRYITKEVAMETFVPEFVLPKKWYLSVTQEMLPEVNIFIHEHMTNYEGYVKTWSCSIEHGRGSYLHYPQIPDSRVHTDFRKTDGYVEITTEQFRSFKSVKTVTESPIKLAEKGHKLYTIEEVQLALNKEYDKTDVEDIINIIKKIK